MKVDVVAYDPAWPAGFVAEVPRLQQALTLFIPRIEHIGSTAVPGLAAKPVIDILIGLPDGDDLDAAAFALLRLDYIYIRHYERYMPSRRYLIRVVAPADAELPAIVDSELNQLDRTQFPHTHHLHMVETGSEFWNRHLLFRDYLRRHDSARDAYAALKQELALQDWSSGNDYAAAKSDFVKEIEARALAEQAKGG